MTFGPFLTARCWTNIQDRETGQATIGQFSLMLSAWQDRDTEWLANASSVVHVHYDTDYSHLRWNVTAAPLAVPGTVRLSLAPIDATSAALVKDTQYAWWFRYRFAGYGSGTRLNFVEDPSIELRLPPPHFDLSLSEPGIYYVGIFASFSTGGIVSHRAPLPQSDGTYHPFAVIIPYGARQHSPPLDLCNKHGHFLCALRRERHYRGATEALSRWILDAASYSWRSASCTDARQCQESFHHHF